MVTEVGQPEIIWSRPAVFYTCASQHVDYGVPNTSLEKNPWSYEPHIYLSIHSSLLIKSRGLLEPIPVVTGGRQDYTLDRLHTPFTHT